MLRDAYGANVHIFKTEIPHVRPGGGKPILWKKHFLTTTPGGKATLAYEQLAREVLTLGRKKELGRGGFAPHSLTCSAPAMNGRWRHKRRSVL